MWVVIVEELLGWGDGRRSQVSRREEIDSSDPACARARELAHRHLPEHPMVERRREVYRRGDDEFLVTVTGRREVHSFRVGVWQLDEPLPQQH